MHIALIANSGGEDRNPSSWHFETLSFKLVLSLASIDFPFKKSVGEKQIWAKFIGLRWVVRAELCPPSTLRRVPFLLWMWYIFVLCCAAVRLPQQIDQVNQEPVKKQYGCSKQTFQSYWVTGYLRFYDHFQEADHFISFCFLALSVCLQPTGFRSAICFSEHHYPLHAGPGPFDMVVTSFITMNCNVADSAKEIYALKEHFEKKLIQS